MTALASAWTLTLRDLTMGAGTRYRIYDAPQGLGLPAVRSSDSAYLSADGVYASGDYHDGRPLALGLVILGDTPAHAEDLARTLAGAWQASREDLELTIRVASDRSYLLRGRPRRCDLDLKELKYGHARAAVMFMGTDPRLYSAEATETIVPLGSGTMSGLTFPLTFPLAFQAGSVPPGLATLNNTGTTESYPTITIAGTVATPRVENVTTGATLELDLSLTGSDVVVVDMAKRRITYNGANALGALTSGSDFWALAAGENLVSFRAPISTTSATATFTYRSAWL